jgi:hypothetical protein
MTLQQRLYILVLVSVIPALAIQFYGSIVSYRERETQVHQEVLRLAEYVSGELDRSASARLLLILRRVLAPPRRARRQSHSFYFGSSLALPSVKRRSFHRPQLQYDAEPAARSYSELHLCPCETSSAVFQIDGNSVSIMVASSSSLGDSFLQVRFVTHGLCNTLPHLAPCPENQGMGSFPGNAADTKAFLRFWRMPAPKHLQDFVSKPVGFCQIRTVRLIHDKCGNFSSGGLYFLRWEPAGSLNCSPCGVEYREKRCKDVRTDLALDLAEHLPPRHQSLLLRIDQRLEKSSALLGPCLANASGQSAHARMSECIAAS